MTGPEHFRAAEKLVDQMERGQADWEPAAAIAQVHATLALAAATALNDAETGLRGPAYEAWRKVAADGES